jgi:hypothetical protein
MLMWQGWGARSSDLLERMVAVCVFAGRLRVALLQLLAVIHKSRRRASDGGASMAYLPAALTRWAEPRQQAQRIQCTLRGPELTLSTMCGAGLCCGVWCRIVRPTEGKGMPAQGGAPPAAGGGERRQTHFPCSQSRAGLLTGANALCLCVCLFVCVPQLRRRAAGGPRGGRALAWHR